MINRLNVTEFGVKIDESDWEQQISAHIQANRLPISPYCTTHSWLKIKRRSLHLITVQRLSKTNISDDLKPSGWLEKCHEYVTCAHGKLLTPQALLC